MGAISCGSEYRTMRLVAIAIRKAKTAARLPPSAWLLLVIAWPLLGLSRLLVLTVPFPVIARVLGRRCPVNARSVQLETLPSSRAVKTGRLIRLAARYCPWTANCFPQAITASLILKAMGIAHVVFFGVRRGDEKPLEAHAWVEADAAPVVGGRGHAHFTAVAAFASGKQREVDRV